MILWLVAAAMTAIVVAALLWPLLARRDYGAADRRAFDRAVFGDQLAELARDRARGLIDADQEQAARAEIARRLLATDADAVPPPSSPPPRLGGLAIGLAIALPLAALLLYGPGGKPFLPSQPFAERPAADRAEVATAVAEAEALRRRLDETPGDLAGWTELAERWIALGRADRAVEPLERAVGLSGGDPVLTSLYGEALVQESGGIVTAQALAAFERVAAADPEEPRARFYQGLARAQAGDDRGALDRWQPMMRASPPDAPWIGQLRGQMTAAAIRLGLDPADAIPAPAAARAANPSGDAAAAIAALSPEERQQAIRAMVDGLAARLEGAPDDLGGWLRLGRARLVLGEPAAALAAYERALALAPADPAVLNAYADAGFAAGLGENPTPRLETAMRRLLELEPANASALWFLGIAAVRDGHPQEAVRLLALLRDQLAPGSPERRAVEGRIADMGPAP
jgi:cytochrome c-type biogenesis protein CcmH